MNKLYKVRVKVTTFRDVDVEADTVENAKVKAMREAEALVGGEESYVDWIEETDDA